MKALAPFERDKEGLSRALERLCLIWRDVSVRKSGGETMLSGADELCDLLAGKLSFYGCLRLQEVCRDAQLKLTGNLSGPLLITWLSGHLRGAVLL